MAQTRWAHTHTSCFLFTILCFPAVLWRVVEIGAESLMTQAQTFHNINSRWWKPLKCCLKFMKRLLQSVKLNNFGKHLPKYWICHSVGNKVARVFRSVKWHEKLINVHIVGLVKFSRDLKTDLTLIWSVLMATLGEFSILTQSSWFTFSQRLTCMESCCTGH